MNNVMNNGMSKVVVISGHPDLESSFTNKVILDQVQSRLNDVEVRRLDTLYPDFNINVEAEQKALSDADVIVLQFPFYWYSVPALMKKWIDDVFSFNFAYGPEGDKLKDKDFILSFTVGGPDESYDPLGYNHFTIEELMRPLQQTAYLAGMNYRKPVYTHRMVYIPGVYNKLEEVQQRAADHAERLTDQIKGLLNDPTEMITTFVSQWFGQFDVLPEDNSYFLQYLSDSVQWRAPEGNFEGHSGFNDWYAVVRNTFKPGCQHIVEQVEVKQEGEEYQVQLRIRLIADTFAGDSINLLVNENWTLTMEADQIQIKTYQVVPV